MAILDLMEYAGIFIEILSELRDRQNPSFQWRNLHYEVLPKKAVILKGVRRSGKSTFLQQIEETERSQGRTCLSMNFVDERLAGLTAKELGGIFDAFYLVQRDASPDAPLTLLLDEIQVINGWEAFVDRQLRIKDRRVFITGSSAKLLSGEIATTMRGRSLSYEVFPFNFGEYLDYLGLRPAKLPLGEEPKAAIKAQFYSYLFEGGFPETIGRSRTTQVQVLQEYFDVLLLRDVIERHNASSPVVVKRFLSLMIHRFASTYTVNRFTEQLRSQGLGVSKSHVSEMIEWFHDAYAIFPLSMFSESLHKQNTNPKKIYAIDNGLINAMVAGRNKNEGRLLENLLFLELRRRYADLYYYKTKDGYEVDFYSPRSELLVQVSWSLHEGDTRKRELRALEQAMEELKLERALLVTADESSTFKVNAGTIQIVPAWQCCLEEEGVFT